MATHQGHGTKKNSLDGEAIGLDGPIADLARQVEPTHKAKTTWVEQLIIPLPMVLIREAQAHETRKAIIDIFWRPARIEQVRNHVSQFFGCQCCFLSSAACGGGGTICA